MATEIELGFEMPNEVFQVRDWIKNGKPELGWRGDPRIDLHVGIITTSKSGLQQDPDGKTRMHRAGDKVGWCWIVTRHCEDGVDRPVLQLKGLELYDLIPKLIEMDPRTPGFENVMDRVEREDALVQKHAEDRIKDAQGEATEHLWRLVQERLHGRSTTRQVGGSDERPDRNLAKT